VDPNWEARFFWTWRKVYKIAQVPHGALVGKAPPRPVDLHRPVVSQVPAGPARPTYESNLRNRVSSVSVAHSLLRTRH
jgi:hypothetical protein